MLYTDEDLRQAVVKATNFCEVCRYLGIKPTGGSYYNAKRRIHRLNLDTSHFVKDKKILCRNINIRKKPISEILVIIEEKQGRTERSKLVRALIESNIPYQCSICNNDGIWFGKDLILQVDHKDGDWKNNQIENLRFLCPNCHTQTPTYGNKGEFKQWQKFECLDCKKRCSSIRCNDCAGKFRQQNNTPNFPDKEEFAKLLWEKPAIEIAKMFNLSDKAIEKRAKKLGLSKPPRGYWQKRRSTLDKT
jgi:5-methylcytosine-specific restriction endonuclease McrA